MSELGQDPHPSDRVRAAQERSIYAHRRVIETATRAHKTHEIAALGHEERVSRLRSTDSARDLVWAAQASAAREHELADKAKRLGETHRDALLRHYGITVAADRDDERSAPRGVSSAERVRSDTRENTHTHTHQLKTSERRSPCSGASSRAMVRAWRTSLVSTSSTLHTSGKRAESRTPRPQMSVPAGRACEVKLANAP